ncbi:hypothetical protein [Listeria booriae]|uniref:hypothetical protein n=1 Tax=Listeria booriae TaxID=1552123 RepID=UPI001627C93E|nr:hypothetical protein [Listeria booriae]MBC1272968.1 hypothetical protein [Listeria booriae]MBC1292484.1 hypothetical protein [Listeria booriae]MBC2391983.1 hypothetical protein [Listeria booriae]
MNRYDKILIGIYSPELKCFADEGDILFLPQKGDTTKKLFRPREGTSYFVSLTKARKPNAIGIVKRINGGITAEELAKLNCLSLENNNSPEDLERYEQYLKRINTFSENQPVSLYLQDTFGSKEKTPVIRKAIVRGYDELDLDTLFQPHYELSVSDYLI